MLRLYKLYTENHEVWSETKPGTLRGTFGNRIMLSKACAEKYADTQSIEHLAKMIEQCKEGFQKILKKKELDFTIDLTEEVEVYELQTVAIDSPTVVETKQPTTNKQKLKAAKAKSKNTGPSLDLSNLFGGE